MPERPIQAGWTRVAFGDVVRQIKERVDPETSGLERLSPASTWTPTTLRIRRWGDDRRWLPWPRLPHAFQAGHVLYGSRRTYLRKVAVADFEGITANTTYVLEPKDPTSAVAGTAAVHHADRAHSSSMPSDIEGLGSTPTST